MQIVEVIRRSEQGVTRPFICRGDDGETYFVKGKGAGRRSQICEWIAGRLAQYLALPVAPFAMVEVPEELLEWDAGLGLSDLGAGPAFGSREQRVTELTLSSVAEVPESLRQDVLIFDWWIHNGDRTLTAKGGNPNLLWSPGDRRLVIIDHNQAFNMELKLHELVDLHVFSSHSRELSGDFFRREEYNKKLAAALSHWPDIKGEIPALWLYADEERTVPVDFDWDSAYQLLLNYQRDDFWIWR